MSSATPPTRLGDAAGSARAYERAAAAAEQLGALDDQAEALFRLAGPTALFHPEGAIAACERAIAVGRASGHGVIEQRGRLLAACWRILFHGWTEQDSAACRTSVDQLRKNGVDPLPAHDLMLLAHVQFIQSEYAESAASARLGLETLTAREALWDSVAGMTAEAVASMYLGRYGHAYWRLQNGLEMARKNGNRPWEGILQSVLASVHLHTCDFAQRQGDRRRAPDRRSATRRSTRSASTCSSRADSPSSGPAISVRRAHHLARRWTQGADALFPLHWYFRMFGRLGLGEVALAEGALTEASAHAGLLLKEVDAGREVTIQALAWDLQARIALARDERPLARQSVTRALTCLEAATVPMAAWRVYDTARAVELRSGNTAAANEYRQQAMTIIDRMAVSLDPWPDLRDGLLRDARVREILDARV